MRFERGKKRERDEGEGMKGKGRKEKWKVEERMGKQGSVLGLCFTNYKQCMSYGIGWIICYELEDMREHYTSLLHVTSL